MSLRQLFDCAVSCLAVPPWLTLIVYGLDGLPALVGYPTLLRQVLRNLLENALHAIINSGEITVRARCLGDRIDVAIADSGPGVAPTSRKRLFEPLISAKAGGTGLGLSLVKRFIERHGGTIAYAPEGAGARFVITLPVGPPKGHEGAAHA